MKHQELIIGLLLMVLFFLLGFYFGGYFPAQNYPPIEDIYTW